jgi:peptide/bleomycin uptake transporter
MYAQYFCAREHALKAYGLAALIVGLWLLNAYLNLRMNDWTLRFYDHMEAAVSSNATLTGRQLGAGGASMAGVQGYFSEWALINGLNVLLQPTINFITRHWAFQWREALTADYLFRWRTAAEGERAGAARGIEGASQRVQDDCYKLTSTIDSLAQGALAAVLQTATFIPVLWRVSSGLPGTPDGVLVLVSLGGNAAGYAISLCVGRFLVHLEYENQATEAAFRKELVYAEDDVAGFGLLATCHRLFRAMRANYHRLFNHLCYFEFWSAIFQKGMELVPIVLMAPYVFMRLMTFGTYMSAISAWQSVQAGITAPMQRWVEINILLSVIRRLREFEDALPPADSLKAADESTRLIAP